MLGGWFISPLTGVGTNPALVVSFVGAAILLAIENLFRPAPRAEATHHKELMMKNDIRNLDANSHPLPGDDYGPAYGFGMNARGRYPGRDFDDVESEMSSDWASRGASILSWEWAKHAARDAWNRISPSSRLCV